MKEPNVEMLKQIGAAVMGACVPRKAPFKLMIARASGSYMVTVRKIRDKKIGLKFDAPPAFETLDEVAS